MLLSHENVSVADYSMDNSTVEPQDRMLEAESGLPTAVAPQAIVDFNLSGPFFEADLQNSFDWMFQQGFDDVFASDAIDHFDSLAMPPGFAQTGQGLDQGSTVGLALPMLQSASRPRSPLARLTVSRVDNHGYPEDRWPMEWKAKPVSLASLPSFEQSTHDGTSSSFYRLPAIDQNLRSTFIELLRAPLEQVTWPSVNLSAFPSSLMIDSCIDRYFACFDKVWSIRSYSSNWLMSTSGCH